MSCKIHSLASAQKLLGPSGVPAGWELVCSRAVEDRATGYTGALVRNLATGVFKLCAQTILRPVDQDEAARIAADHQ